MIDIKLLYAMYVKIINLKINNVLEESLSYHTIHSNLIERLYDYEPYIDLCTTTCIKKILGFTSMKQFNSIIYNNSQVFINSETYSRKALELYIKNYININSIIVKNEKQIDRLKNQLISFPQYRRTIMIFNKYLTDVMIEEGYVFNPGSAFGLIYISKIVMDKPRVNLPESMKIRRELESKGIATYNSETGLGEKYFVYYPLEDFMIKWHRPENLRRYFPYISDFKFVPPKTNFDGSWHKKMRDFTRQFKDKANILFDRIQYERA